MKNASTSESFWGDGETLTAVFVFIAAIFYLLRSRKKNRSNSVEALPLPPGPRGLPILGNLPFMKSDLHVYFKELADTHGSVFSLKLGARLCVVLSSPEAAKEALKDNDVIFANHDVPIVAFISSYGAKDVAWAPYGDYWRLVRRLMRSELLSPATIDGLVEIRRKEVRRMVKEISEMTGMPLNVRELVCGVGMDMSTAMLWGGSGEEKGKEWKALEREFLDAMDDLVRLFGAANVSDFFPALAALDLQGLARKTRKLSDRISLLLDRIIDDRRRKMGTEKTRDMLQVLLELGENPDPESRLSIGDIKALLIDTLSGGTDTVSTTVEWAMAELLRHPEKMKRAKEEIAAVVGERNEVEETHLPALKYLKSVMKETLRLHPVLPLLFPHKPSSTCAIAGYRIPEGAKVFVNVWAIQRDPRVWEDAAEFKPERFLGQTGKLDFSGKNFKYFPFGAGRRICAGVSLGERVVMFVLASLLHSVDWVLPEAEAAAFDLKENFGLVMRKEKPLFAVPVKANGKCL